MVFSVFAIVPIASTSAAENAFVKVTSELEDWSGTYLIVYEIPNEGNGYVFNSKANMYTGANLIIENNVAKSFGLSEGYIDFNDVTESACVTIEKIDGTDNYSIKIDDNNYIGKNNNSNGIDVSESKLENTIEWDSDCVKITSTGGAIMRFNTNTNQFRYYKSSTYTNQKPIQLYKLSDAVEEPELPEQIAECTYSNAEGDVFANVPITDDENPDELIDGAIKVEFYSLADYINIYSLAYYDYTFYDADGTEIEIAEDDLQVQNGVMHGLSSEFSVYYRTFDFNDDYSPLYIVATLSEPPVIVEPTEEPIEEGPTHYESGQTVNMADLKAGDTIGLGVTITNYYYHQVNLVGGTYALWWGTLKDVKNNDYLITHITSIGTDSNGLLIQDQEWEFYAFTNVSGGYSDTIYVLAADQENKVLTLGGFDPSTLPTTYTITWKNWDGEVLATDTVEEGVTPSYEGTPAKAADAQYTYTFTGWDKDVVAATADAEYIAQFSSDVNEYTITWKNDDGSVIDTTTVAYGTVPTHEDAAKDEDDQNTYEFAGWTPELIAVEGDAEYTATFNAIPKEIEPVIPDGPNANGWFYLDGVRVDAYKLLQFEGDWYFIAENHKYVTNAHRKLTAAMVEGTDFAPGFYDFDEDGKMILDNFLSGPNANGLFYLNNERLSGYSLVEFEGDWYFIAENHRYVKNATRYLSASIVEGTGFAAGSYSFDASGKMIYKNGPQADGTFYVNNEKQSGYKLVSYENKWYLVAEYNKIAKGQTRYLNASMVEGTDFAVGYYQFDEDGKMIFREGPQADGTFYLFNEKQKAYKLIAFDSEWYLVAEYNKIAKGQRRYLNASMVEGTDFAVGYYNFDADGKMILN